MTESFDKEPIQTRTQTALKQGIPLGCLSHFGYPSESAADQELITQPMQEETQQPVVLLDFDDLEPLFSDQEELLPDPARSLLPSPSGTSAPLLSNPALTHTFSNFPSFISRTGSSGGVEPIDENEPQGGTDREFQAPGQNPVTLLTPDGTVRGKGRPRGRSRSGRRSTTSSSRAIARTNRRYTRSRGRVRTRA